MKHGIISLHDVFCLLISVDMDSPTQGSVYWCLCATACIMLAKLGSDWALVP